MQHPWDTQAATLPVGGVGVPSRRLIDCCFRISFFARVLSCLKIKQNSPESTDQSGCPIPFPGTKDKSRAHRHCIEIVQSTELSVSKGHSHCQAAHWFDWASRSGAPTQVVGAKRAVMSSSARASGPPRDSPNNASASACFFSCMDCMAASTVPSAIIL